MQHLETVPAPQQRRAATAVAEAAAAHCRAADYEQVAEVGGDARCKGGGDGGVSSVREARQAWGTSATHAPRDGDNMEAEEEEEGEEEEEEEVEEASVTRTIVREGRLPGSDLERDLSLGSLSLHSTYRSVKCRRVVLEELRRLYVAADDCNGYRHSESQKLVALEQVGGGDAARLGLLRSLMQRTLFHHHCRCLH